MSDPFVILLLILVTSMFVGVSIALFVSIPVSFSFALILFCLMILSPNLLLFEAGSVHVFLTDALLVLVLFIWFIERMSIAQSKSRIAFSYLHWAIAAVLACSLIATFWGMNQGFGTKSLYDARSSLYLLLFLPVGAGVRSRPKLGLVAALLPMIVGAIPAMLKFMITFTTGQRALVATADSYMLIGFLLALTILASVRYVPPALAWVSGLTGPVFLVALIVTQTRGLWIGAVTGLLILFLLLVRGKRASNVAKLILIVLVFTTLVYLGDFALPAIDHALTMANERITLALGVESSVQYRLNEYIIGLDTFENSPLVGLGFGSTLEVETTYFGKVYVGYLHNAYLWFFVKMGFLGLLSYLWFLVALLVSSYNVYKSYAEARYGVLGLGLFVAQGALFLTCFSSAWIVDCYTSSYLGVNAGILIGLSGLTAIPNRITVSKLSSGVNSRVRSILVGSKSRRTRAFGVKGPAIRSGLL